MNPHFQSWLVNDPFGDSALYVRFKFEPRALLFDLGELGRLSPRQLLQVSHAFVSHTHMDHFAGFDRLLRVLVGREKRLHLFGPGGIIANVEGKLGGYTWNLAPTFVCELVIAVTEVADRHVGRHAEFRLTEGFATRHLDPVAFEHGVLMAEPAFRVRFAILDHGVPCLAYALEETRHVNVWRNEVEAMGFPVGPWLKELKDAVLRGDADASSFRIVWREGGENREAAWPLGELKRRLLSIVPGQRIVYVTDAAPHADNAAAIVALARDADVVYAEAAFLDADAELARTKMHLTARIAGTLARRAGARALVPFHFSPRYSGRGDALAQEAMAAFAGSESGQ